MEFKGLWYLLLLTFLFAIIYLVLFFGLPKFFGRPGAKLDKRSLFSIALIALLSLGFYFISYTIPDLQLANRFLHAFGGGFLAGLTCFLAVRDSRLQLTKFQCFIITFLIVTALGVGNELLEFFFQTTTGEIFSDTTIDTWLDLTSNTVGALLSLACFTPFVSRHKA